MDVVVTVPKLLWTEWLREGNLPGTEWDGYSSHFWIRAFDHPDIQPGERVYIVAHGKLSGYAPLVIIEYQCRMNPDKSCLMRKGGAVAVTIEKPIVGFQGWRYRWWDRQIEVPFPDFREV